MNLVAYARLLHMKINSAHRKAVNPFINSCSVSNPFSRPMYTTLVWIEQDDIKENDNKKG